ncbi:MAG: DUF4062 domain-containing protein [Actinomycetota bacterium]|nr:DUF4062 domain-containing protein [Actinomycetota bacterium]
MPFNATVFRVLIASPGDTGEARKVLQEAIEAWNSLHAEDTGLVLLSVLWERDAWPKMGDHPQSIINRQLVDQSDLLIGTFWTRLGTPTPNADSGTVEEIKLFIEAGKPVLLYFCDQPVHPESVDPAEYARLVRFRDSLKDSGLYDTYGSTEELWRKVTAALTRTVRENFLGDPAARLLVSEVAPPSGRLARASLLARIERERELSGFSKSGSPRYRTRERLLLENRGDAAAENVSFRFEVPEGTEGEAPSTFGNDAPIVRLPPGGSVEYPLMTHVGTAMQWDIIFSWQEDGEDYEDRQTLR